MNRLRLKKIFQLPWLPIWLAPLALLSPLLFTGKAMFWGTPVLQFVPWWNWALETLKSGHLPLWNPLVGMGAPLLANYQSALLYPPNWLYFLLGGVGGLPVLAWGQGVLVYVHLVWAGAGMAVLARSLGLGRLAQTVSGVSFGLSAYLVSRAGFLSINSSVAWIPWIVWAATLTMDHFDRGYGSAGRTEGFRLFIPTQAGMRALLILALMLSMQLLAGHAQTTWYTWMLSGLWVVVYGWQSGRWREDGSDDKTSRKAVFMSFLRRLPGLGGAFLFAAGLAAAQIIPTAEYLLQSQRSSSVDFEFALNYSAWPWRFITLLAPDFFGNPVRGDYWGYANFWEDAMYIGLLPFLLAAGVLIKLIFKRLSQFNSKQSGVIGFLSGLLLLSIVFALGKNTPIYPWLYQYVPTFDMFQAPARYLIWAEFALALLAGFGVQSWRRPQKRALYWTRLSIAAAVSVVLGAGLGWVILSDVSPTFLRATAIAGLWGISAAVLSLTAPPKPGPDPGDEVRLQFRWWAPAVALLICADLIFAGWGLIPGIQRGYYSGLAEPSQALSATGPNGRLYLPPEEEESLKFNEFFLFDSFQPVRSWELLPDTFLPNIPMLAGIPMANNFDPMLPGRYVRWMEFLQKSSPEIQERLLNLMAVEIVVNKDASRSSGVGLDRLGIGVAERFNWVSCARMFTEGEAVFALLASDDFDPQREVLIESPVANDSTDCHTVLDAEIALIDESPNRVALRVTAESAGWLVLSDTWYPGWRVKVDGQSTQLLRANYLFCAAAVPAGEHQVVFEYRPWSFYVGVLVSVLCLLLWAAFWYKLKNR